MVCRATRKIRQLEKTNELEAAKIIALTGLLSDDVQKEAYASGMDLYMTKPVKLKHLSDILAKLFM